MTIAAEMDWQQAERTAQSARRDADAKYIELWNARMAVEGISIQPSPTLGMAARAGYLYLRVNCKICRTSAFKELASIRRPPSTEIWKLEGSLFCEPCRDKGARSPRGTIERLCRKKTRGYDPED